MFALSSYDYFLPKHLIATAPIYPREAAKLLVYDRATGRITHTTFAHLLEFIPKDCIITLNNTRVLKARIYGKKLGSNTTREIFFHRFATRDERAALESTFAQALESTFSPKSTSALESTLLNSHALALCQIRGRVKVGDIFAYGRFYAQVVALLDNGYRVTRFFAQDRESSQMPLNQEAVLAMLEEIGHIPLPPYIKRASNDNDIKDYQTLFATQAGAIAAPTASLHLSTTMLEALKEQIAYLTLHIGAGTFASVDVPDIREHTMHTESLHITAQALEKLLCAKSRLCVGTSALRSVEFAARLYEAHPKPYTDLHAQCDIFLHLGNKPRYVDYLLTNFHLPKSTLTMLVASMVGYEQWRKIYEQAIAKEYRFYSYGDAMLIL